MNEPQRPQQPASIDAAARPLGAEGRTRREAIAVGAGLVGAGLVAVGAAASGSSGATSSSAHGQGRPGSSQEGSGGPQGPASGGHARQPVVFVPHGGGPWPFVETGLGSKAEQDEMATYLRSLASVPAVAPRAILMISAHWEEAVPTVSSATRPPMLYDYYGFPPASYEITWPAPGEPALAARVRKLLEAAGFATAEDPRRGFDHGTFVPLKLAYPAAEIPTVQLSLKRGLDPAEHLALGRALAPLRDEGIFIVGSGMTYHNLRGFGPGAAPVAEAFDAWLREAMSQPPDERARRLRAWSEAPAARKAHPREEHLLPLMVIAGAAGEDRATIPYQGSILGLRLSAYHFGA